MPDAFDPFDQHLLTAALGILLFHYVSVEKEKQEDQSSCQQVRAKSIRPQELLNLMNI